MPSPRLITFDAAGTLIHVREPVGETYAAFGRRHGVDASAAALKVAFHSNWGRIPAPHWPEGESSQDDDRSWWHGFAHAVFAEALGDPLPDTVFAPLFDDLYRHYAQPEAWVVYDDVYPTLDKLAGRCHLCVLSNFDRRLVGILEGLGLAPYFGRIILSSEVGAAKPHARMFVAAQNHFSISPEECLHVGDDDRCDIQGACANGWQAFAVKRPETSLSELFSACG